MMNGLTQMVSGWILQTPFGNIIKKLFSLFLLGKIYRKYQVLVFNKVLFFNPLKRVIYNMIALIYNDLV